MHHAWTTFLLASYRLHWDRIRNAKPTYASRMSGWNGVVVFNLGFTLLLSGCSSTSGSGDSLSIDSSSNEGSTSGSGDTVPLGGGSGTSDDSSASSEDDVTTSNPGSNEDTDSGQSLELPQRDGEASFPVYARAYELPLSNEISISELSFTVKERANINIKTANAYEEDVFSKSYRSDSIFLENITYETSSQKLSFQVDPSVSHFTTNIVSLQNLEGDEVSLAVMKGFIQSIQKVPLFSKNIASTKPISMKMNIEKLHEFSSDFVVYLSSHNQSNLPAGTGEYTIDFKNNVNSQPLFTWTGELNTNDESNLPLWKHSYHYDELNLSFKQSTVDNNYTVTAELNGVKEEFMVAASDHFFIEMSVDDSTLQRPYMELTIENDRLWVATDPLFYAQPNLYYSKVPDVWAMGYTGQGVEVLLIEDSFQIDHPDLKNNVSTSSLSTTSSNDHGTSVAGIIAADAGNGIGLAGVAPDADLVYKGSGLSSHFVDGATARVWNNSWGPDDGTGLLGDFFYSDHSAILKRAAVDEDIIILFANGNGGVVERSSYDAYVNSIYTLSIQAITFSGEMSSYGEEGPAITASFYNESDLNGLSQEGGIVTTTTDDYTASFSGTSSAAPMASGIVALMLDARADANWRDVINVFAEVGKNNDPLDEGWITNLAGMDFNHKYGFGVVHADDAVEGVLNDELIISDSPLLSLDKDDLAANKTFGDNNIVGERIEFLTLELDLKGAQKNQDEWTIKLTHTDTASGESSESIFATAHSTTANRLDYDGWMFSSLLHWGESLDGEWSLDISTRNSGSITSSVLDSWDIEFYYHIA